MCSDAQVADCNNKENINTALTGTVVHDTLKVSHTFARRHMNVCL